MQTFFVCATEASTLSKESIIWFARRITCSEASSSLHSAPQSEMQKRGSPMLKVL